MVQLAVLCEAQYAFTSLSEEQTVPISLPAQSTYIQQVEFFLHEHHKANTATTTIIFFMSIFFVD